MFILGSLKSALSIPISVDWTYFARCYRWGATSEYWLKIGDFAPTGSAWPKISGRRCRPHGHQPFFSSENWAKWSFICYKKYGQIFSSVLSQCTRLTDGQTDGRTDGQTDSFLVTRPPCIQCSAVKADNTKYVRRQWCRMFSRDQAAWECLGRSRLLWTQERTAQWRQTLETSAIEI